MTTHRRPRTLPHPLPLTLMLATTLLLVSCATSINRVISDPSRYRGREVTVTGTVSDSFSLVGRGAYRLRDGSGQIWVVSERGVPRSGARVSVTGTVREAFNLGPLGAALPAGLGNGVVLVERSHRLK